MVITNSLSLPAKINIHILGILIDIVEREALQRITNLIIERRYIPTIK